MTFLTVRHLIVPLLAILANSVSAKKHIFHTSKDGRFLIAPIGEPFGFVEGGSCTLTVYDYELTEKRSMTKKDKKKNGGFFSSGKSGQGDEYDDNMLAVNSNERSFEGGFVLKRFETESDFIRFEEEIIEDPSICVYDAFRNERRRQLEDVDDYYYIDWMSYDDDGVEYDDFLKTDDDQNDFVKYGNIPQFQDVGTDGIYLSMRDLSKWGKPEGDGSAPAIQHQFKRDEEGLYFLIYQVCPTSSTALFSEVRSSFKVDLQLHNFDKFGRISYLTAGELHLPMIFFFFSISYFLMVYIWNQVLKGEDIFKKDSEIPRGKVGVRAVHHLMTALVFLKAASMLFEAIRYHFIALHGHAELWSFVYYSLTFLKGVMLFSVILLIGSGWSLVKPFLHEREKKIVFFVLLLQILDNIAVVVLLSETEGERQYENWKAILHLIDIICCCTVLLPIVWQVSTLEADAETEESARTVEKLKLFRSFYLLVMAYIYFTRVIVYLVATILSYKYTWVSTVLTELGTVTFFLVVGYYFRPVEELTAVEMATRQSMNQDDAEYGEVEPLCMDDELYIPDAPKKKNID